MVDETPSNQPPKAKTVRLKPKPKTREQSSIAFPYVDMDVGITVAAAILAGGGVPVSREQLAGLMNSSLNSGSFLMKLSAARMFGFVVSTAQGKFELTNLGFSVLDNEVGRQKAARAEAFLNVALYRRLYDEFRGKQLPPRPHGLEQAITKFGVATNQKTNARLAFDKSATQAGFFPNGPDRLIEPIIGPVSRPVASEESVADREVSDDRFAAVMEAGVRRSSRNDLHPFVQGLINALPAPATTWTIEGRAKWLQAAANNFDLMYKGTGSITISAKAGDEGKEPEKG